jgi:2-oxo-4-hydroxy-4-carboxy-5-ureidoimidazoline decarboxylase
MDGNDPVGQSAGLVVQRTKVAMSKVQATATLAQINAADETGFMKILGGVFEHSPWVAQAVYSQRPFASLESLWRAMTDCVANASDLQKFALIKAHPELAGAEAKAGSMTLDSTSEQGRLGLTALSPQEALELDHLNRAYQEKFGFPCIIALRLHDSKTSVLDEFRRRLSRARPAEIMAALDQIGVIVRGRLEQMISIGAGWLTTHVLDTHAGQPAAGMSVELAVGNDDGWRCLATTTTNAQGRTDQPLLAVGAMARGRYRLSFGVDAYYRERGVVRAALPFLDEVVLAFGVADVDSHYHVPLLCTPWSYTTYRGS